MSSKIIFSDFDGTLTLNGQISQKFFDILGLLEKFQYKLVIVSGRSLSWGHFFMTHFPIHAAIMEGGGVICYKKDGKMTEHCLVDQENLDHLGSFDQLLLKNFANLKLSQDSFGRKTDRAIELYDLENCLSDVEELLKIQKINYSCSNVHLNYWRGDISKYNASKYYCEKILGENNLLKNSLFFGDALNDQSMFKELPKAVGVSNIIKYLDKMESRPKTILEGEVNIGPFGVYNYLADYLK